MSWQTLLSIIAAAIGFVSAIWFCVGSLGIKPSDIIETADESWDAAEAKADAIIAQSAQNLAGALLLVASFVLQVLAIQAPSTIVQWQLLARTHPLVPALVAGGCALAISHPIAARRRAILKRQVQLLMSQRLTQPPP